MKKLIFAVTVGLFCLSVSAMAEDAQQTNVIRVIHDDGHTDILEIPKNDERVSVDPAVSPIETGPSSKVKEAIEHAVAKSADESKKGQGKDKIYKNKKKKSKKPVSYSGDSAAISKYPAQTDNSGRSMEKPKPYQLPSGTVLTPEIAKRIALDYAPPARSVEVLPRQHNGREVFVVRFRTDSGFKDVLIDRKNGAPILN